MKRYLAEFIGTFAIVFCGTGAIIVNEQSGVISHAGIAITFGLIVMVMIYAVGNISGAHFNPAVTIAFTAAKKFPLNQLGQYILAQSSGALFASLILKFLFPDNILFGATLPAGSEMQSFILEVIITFFLMFVIVNVAHGSKEQGMFAGLAIGATVLLGSMFAGPVSGASMNPARSFSPAVISGMQQHLWIYLTAPIIGAVIAVFVHRFLTETKISEKLANK